MGSSARPILLKRSHPRPARRRYAGRFHRVLRERLRALQPGRSLAGAEGKATARGKRVDESTHQRRLRTDDGEVDVLALDRGQQPLDVVDRDLEQARVRGDARVTRRAQQLRLLGRALQRAHDRVLAPARADDEDLHVRGWR